MIIKLRLKELLLEKNMSQKELSKLTDIREATISEMSRNARTGVNFEHLIKISTALGVNDIREIIEMKVK